MAGLGDEGELRGSDLVNTVRQAVIAWAQRLTERRPVPARIRACDDAARQRRQRHHGGTGGAAHRAGRARGQRAARRGRRRAQRWPRVSHLQIIELYLDRASEAWRALQVLAAAAAGPLRRRADHRSRASARCAGRGRRLPRRRLRLHQRARARRPKEKQEIVYTLDTKRARSEVRAQPTQVRLIRNLVATASNDANTDAQIGRTLFSCSSRSSSSRSWAAARRRCSSSTRAPPAFRGSCSTQHRPEQSSDALGDPHQAAAQAADRSCRTIARQGRVGRRQHARHRRAGVRPTMYPRCRARGGRRRRSRTASTANCIDRSPVACHRASSAGPTAGDAGPMRRRSSTP